ncbi:MAG TPA: hypothetical protein VFY91_00680 [Microbacterium sp.]|nr:hypothetical protein [Microbacterium sp.]
MAEPGAPEKRSANARGSAADPVSHAPDALIRVSVADAATETELRILRARAYGPDPDIDADPAALARLAELEAAHTRAAFSVGESAVPATPEPVRSSAPVDSPPFPAEPVVVQDERPARVRRPITATPLRLLAVGLGAAALTVIVIAVGMPAGERRPDATLRSSGEAPDDSLLEMLQSEGQEHPLDRTALRGASEMEIDLSTLRAFGTYAELELWAATNIFGSPCLIAVHRASMDVVARSCVPSSATLLIDTGGRELSDSEPVRFVHRGETVDVYFLAP